MLFEKSFFFVSGERGSILKVEHACKMFTIHIYLIFDH